MNIKLLFAALLLLITKMASAQSKEEAQVLALSQTVFRWDITNKVDSLATIFHEKFMVVTGTGDIQLKDQYLNFLRSGNFVHNIIDVEENKATVENLTATVVGKGHFSLTVYGNKVDLHLSYIEVFTKSKNNWKLLAMHFSILPD